MPGISGPSVTVSLTGPHFARLHPSIASTSSLLKRLTVFLLIACSFLLWNCAAFAQTGDITDVHITPRGAASAAAPAAAAAPASAVASPDLPTPSVGLKNTDR